MLEDLIAKRAALDAEIAKAKTAAKAGNIAQVKTLMAELDVSAADISRKPERAQNGKRRIVEDKYRNPSTGETWSGRGKTAKWLAAELANGKTKAEFRVAS